MPEYHAFLTSLPETVVCVDARSHAAARYAVYRQAADAGFGVNWSDARAHHGGVSPDLCEVCLGHTRRGILAHAALIDARLEAR